MRNVLLFAATAAVSMAATPALAAPVVDGTVSGGEYSAATATIATDADAPTSNFAMPGNTAKAGYAIYLNDTNDTLFGAVTQTGGTADGSFVNLYFDIDPATGTGGSELGIEVTNKRGFIAGSDPIVDFDLSSRITFATVTSGDLITTEFSIANSVFRDFIAGAALQGYFGANGYTPQDVRLNLSQSLSYSVAGGASFGPARLGTFNVAAVPEPTTWAMMLAGFGGVGFAMRRRDGQRTAAKA